MEKLSKKNFGKLTILPDVMLSCAFTRDVLAREWQLPYSRDIKVDRRSKLSSVSSLEVVASQCDTGDLKAGQQSGEEACWSSFRERSQTLERKLGASSNAQEGEQKETGRSVSSYWVHCCKTDKNTG